MAENQDNTMDLDSPRKGVNGRSSKPKGARPLPQPPSRRSATDVIKHTASKRSFSERRSASKLPRPSLEPVWERGTNPGQENPVPRERDTVPGDELLPAHQVFSKQRSQYFERVFGSRDDDIAKAPAGNQSMISVELRTNVIVEDEFKLMTEMSGFLAERYQRTPALVTLTLQHGICMFFGGSFDPSYTITIKAVPALLQQAMNKRNRVVIQRYLDSALKVRRARGLVSFVGVAEESPEVAGDTTGLVDPTAAAATTTPTTLTNPRNDIGRFHSEEESEGERVVRRLPSVKKSFSLRGASSSKVRLAATKLVVAPASGSAGVELANAGQEENEDLDRRDGDDGGGGFNPRSRQEADCEGEQTAKIPKRKKSLMDAFFRRPAVLGRSGGT